jgi:hypothetical protein
MMKYPPLRPSLGNIDRAHLGVLLSVGSLQEEIAGEAKWIIRQKSNGLFDWTKQLGQPIAGVMAGLLFRQVDLVASPVRSGRWSSSDSIAIEQLRRGRHSRACGEFIFYYR